MKVLIPRATLPEVPRTPVSPLVRQALDAAFGHRDPATLTGALFDLGVRSHIRARRRTSPSVNRFQIISCHARDNGEFFGSVSAGERRYAYAARIQDGRLVSFKVL
ncbi:hypothetical protein [Corynebacterium sp. HMSC29G08]|uniref:hypothetical protein n=1 Tax=Corynebacterium sp. HMSC29G08 TaxID=1581069 RepID=UPI001FEE461D|nr:hypothetical protein [Corynebacterium sp. HMSC29G08]